MPIYTYWSPVIPAAIIMVIAIFYILIKNVHSMKKLKGLLTLFFILFLSSSLMSLFTMGPLRPVIKSLTPLIIMEILFFFFVMVTVVRLLSFLLFDLMLGKLHNIRYSRLLKIKDVLVIILYIIGILMFVKFYFHFDLTVVAASSAILTAIIGFALQDILGDFFSGIALNLEESLRIGDWIKTANIEGRIEQFRWRSTKVRTLDNTLVVIPNRIASKQEVLRFGNTDEPFIMRMRMGVSYKNSPDNVIAAILEVMESIPSILRKPEPVVMVSEFADFSITYELKFWITDYAAKDPIRSEIRRKIWYVFKRDGIEIPYPVRDIFIKDYKQDTSTPPSPQQMVALLRTNEIFNTIDESQLENLAEDIEIKYYGRGEVLIREGETGQYFFHILNGEAEVLKEGKVLACIKAGDYVGEMSLFTGEKTVADVRVSKESKILRISPERFKEAVRINEKMAWKLSEVIAARRAELIEFSQKEDLSKSTIFKQESENIFLRIKKYFSL